MTMIQNSKQRSKMKTGYYILIIIISTIFMGFSESYEKAKILKIKKNIKLNETEKIELKSKDKVFLEIKSGEEKGKRIAIEVFNHKEDIYNLDLKKNDTVLINITEENGFKEYFLVDHDKRKNILFLSLFFILLVILISGKNGFKAILALILTIILIFYLFVPLILKGFSPLILAVFISAICSLITIIFITGVSKKSLIALFGTIGGVSVASIISMFYIKNMHLTGYTNMEVLTAANMLKGIDMKQLVSAGIIFGSLGAIMDVAVSIASSLSEIKENSREISSRKLYLSGMNIGKDIIGTMVNTLILAYLGSSLITILLFAIQSDSFPLIRILNFEVIVTEFLRALSGSIGIIFSVPITSIIGAKVLSNKD